MAIFSSKDHPLPKRKSKPKPNPWDHDADYTALKAAIANGRMGQNEAKWMYIDEPAMRKKLDIKHPVRTASDSLRRFIKDLGLESDYWVEKSTTDDPRESWVMVCYEPAWKDHGHTQSERTVKGVPKKERG